MSPFAHLLRELREKRKLRQKDAAEILGYEQSYLSALENCGKGPPQKTFINRLIMKYGLNQDEQNQLLNALNQSQRRIVLPLNANIAEYEICHQLLNQLGDLHPQQIELIKFALNLSGTFQIPNQNLFSQSELEESKM